MASTRLWYLATKIEWTKWTWVTPSHFVRYIDWDFMFNQENIENNPIQNNRWGPLYPIAWKQAVAWAFNFDLEALNAPYIMYPALWTISSADVSSGTDTSVYEHTLTVANTLPSYTWEQWKWNISDSTNNLQNYIINRAFWVMVDSFTLSASDWKINMASNFKAYWLKSKRDMISDAAAWASVDISLEDVDWLTTSDTVNIYDETPQSEADAIASISTANKTIQIWTLWNSYTVANNWKVALAPLTPSYVAPQFFTFHQCDFKFGANLTAASSASEENIEDWEFTMENNLEERYWSTKQWPSVIWEKWARATLKFTKYFENREELDQYLRQTRRACEITIQNNTIISATDTNEYKYRVLIELSDLRWTTYEMPTWTDELYAVTLEWTCYYDATDTRAIRIKVRNASAGTVYTA